MEEVVVVAEEEGVEVEVAEVVVRGGMALVAGEGAPRGEGRRGRGRREGREGWRQQGAVQNLQGGEGGWAARPIAFAICAAHWHVPPPTP